MLPDPDDIHAAGQRLRKRGPGRTPTELRFEIAVVALLLLTVIAIRYGDVILSNSVVISAADPSGYGTAAHGDEAAGGSSTVVTNARQPLQWSCELRGKYRYPFCGYEILLGKDAGRGLDLSRYQTITLDLDYQGSADSVRLYLKNYDPRYSHTDVRSTVKFNRAELPVVSGHQTIVAPLSDFDVAEWWIQKNHIPFRLSRPQFDDVVAIEVQTGNGALPGRHSFKLDRVVLRGSIVSVEQWYLGIISCWIVLICLFLISRIMDLQHDLRRRRALQHHAQGEARRAQESARQDHLTRLLNRLGMTDRYQRALAADGDRAVAFILIDIDHFKAVNDRWGHMQGDEVLVAFAALLRQNLREDDLIGRWGGEEFLLVVRGGDADTAMELADKLRGKIEQHDFGIGRGVTASFGVEFSETAPDLLGTGVAHADRALYAAKEQGRNRVVFYYPSAAHGPTHKDVAAPAAED